MPVLVLNTACPFAAPVRYAGEERVPLAAHPHRSVAYARRAPLSTSEAAVYRNLALFLALLALAACDSDPQPPAAAESSAKAGAKVGGVVPKSTSLVESPDPRFVADRQGRVVILRGANFVGSKSGPDYIGKIDEERIARMRTYGFNSVRQLILWEGLEPQMGDYDETYLDAIAVRLDWYAKHGIYVILDMHQDIYGPLVGGDGAPPWATITDGKVFKPVEGGAWYLSALNAAVQAAYRNFWDPEKGHPELQAHYIANWVHVVERFRNHPAVIGYDIMNEPVFSNGDIAATIAFKDAALVSGDWRNERLIGFTQKVVDAIRNVDTDSYIFYEPTSLLSANLGDDIGGPFPGDVIGITDPRKGPPRLGYAPHLYDMTAEQGGGWKLDNPYVKDWEKLRAADRDKQGGVLWLGEFGGANDQPNMADFVRQILDMADRQRMGYALWAYDGGSWSPIGSDGKDTLWATWLTRPYPRAVAGNLESFSYDPKTRVFWMQWTPRKQALGPTEIALPVNRVYPDGYIAVVSDLAGAPAAVKQEFVADQQILVLTTTLVGKSLKLCVAPDAAGCQ